MSLKSIRNILKIVLLVCIIAVGMLPSASDAGEVIKIGGMGSGLEVMKILGDAFEKRYAGTEVQVLPSLGSTGGIRAVAKGAVDIGVSARPLKDDEKKYWLSIQEYAKSPLVVVTRKDTNVSGLSMEDLAKIYDGRMLSWPDGKRIRPVLRPEEDIDSKIIRKMSPEMNRALTAAASREGMLTAVTDQDAAKAIEKTPGSLGFATLAQVITEKLPFNIVRLNGINPSTRALSDGSYKPYKALFLVTGSNPPAKVRNFMEFVGSPDGIKILESSGYVVTIRKKPVR